jgi:hypothetical protein
MAKRVRVIETLIDDLDGTEQPEGSGQTFNFNWQGVDYEIDLSDDHGEALQAMMQPILDAARRTGGRKLPTRRHRAANALGKGEQAALPSGAKEDRADLTTGTSYADAMAKRRFLKRVRVWARENGWPDQGDTGRLKEGVREAWNAAFPDDPVPEETPGQQTIRRARMAQQEIGV